MVFPVPHDQFNAIQNPPSALSISEVRILAKGSLSSLQFANGLSIGISGNEGLSFMVCNVYKLIVSRFIPLCDNDKMAETNYLLCK